MSLLTAPVRRGLAGAAAVALVAGTAVATAPATTAATTVSGATASWGVKETFRNYIAEETGRAPVSSDPRSSITVANGADFAGTKNSMRLPAVNEAPYNWPASTAASSYDPSTRSGTIRLGGSVTFKYPHHVIYEMTFANPTLVLDGKGGGTLKVDSKYDLGAFTGAPQSGDLKQVAFASVSGASNPTQVPTSTGTSITFADLGLTLTDAGAKAFAGQYSAGQEIDPFTVKFDVAQKLKASSATKLTLKKKQAKKLKAGKKGSVVVTVWAAGGTSTAGKVVVKDRKKSLRTKATQGKTRVVVKLPRLKPGKHVLKAVYRGNDDVRASTSTKTTVKVKKK
jgi:hypothetical protein